MIVKTKKGKFIRYDGYKCRRKSKVHTIVSEQSLPLSAIRVSEDEHGSKHFREIMEDIKVWHGIERLRNESREIHADLVYDIKVSSLLRRRDEGEHTS